MSYDEERRRKESTILHLRKRTERWEEKRGPDFYEAYFDQPLDSVLARGLGPGDYP